MPRRLRLMTGQDVEGKEVCIHNTCTCHDQCNREDTSCSEESVARKAIKEEDVHSNSFVFHVS